MIIIQELTKQLDAAKCFFEYKRLQAEIDDILAREKRRKEWLYES